MGFYKVPMKGICAAAASAAPCGFMILGGYLLVDGMTAFIQKDMDVLKRGVAILCVWLVVMGFMKLFDSFDGGAEISGIDAGDAAGSSATRRASLRTEGARGAEVRGQRVARAGTELGLGLQPRCDGGLDRGRSSSWRR